MKTIIVPTDFSDGANNAMEYAAGLAKDTASDILLFHVYQVPISMSDVPIVLVSVEELEKAANARMNEAKRSLQQTVGESVTVNGETRLGDTIDELHATCERVHPFAVVMGSTGTTAFERVFFGSTTLAAVKHLNYPVIVVPPGKKYTHIKEVGFARESNETAETTPEITIKSFVNAVHADLHVLNVTSDNVEEDINNFAEENHLDLVITIPKKHKLLDGLFKKDHTKELVFHSHVPVMCVHE